MSNKSKTTRPTKTTISYTWYPKDWQSSDITYQIGPIERCTYRELIDLAMETSNNIHPKTFLWWKKWNYESEKQLIDSIELLINLGAVERIGETLFIPSCIKRIENRNKNVGNGHLGGRPKKQQNNPNETQVITQIKPNVNPSNNPIVTQHERLIEYNTIEIKEKEQKEKGAGDSIAKVSSFIPKLTDPPISPFPDYLYKSRDKICDALNVTEMKSLQSYKSITHFCEAIFTQGKIQQLEEVARYYPMYRKASGMKAHKPENFTGDPKLNYENGAWCEVDWKAKYTEHEQAAAPKTTAGFFAIPKPEHQ